MYFNAVIKFAVLHLHSLLQASFHCNNHNSHQVSGQIADKHKNFNSELYCSSFRCTRISWIFRHGSTLCLRGGSSRPGPNDLQPEEISFLHTLPPRELQALCEACGELPASSPSANYRVPDMVEALRQVRGPVLEFLREAMDELRSRAAPPPAEDPAAVDRSLAALPRGFLKPGVVTRRAAAAAAASACRYRSRCRCRHRPPRCRRHCSCPNRV